MIGKSKSGIRWAMFVLSLVYLGIQSYSIHKITLNVDELNFATYGTTIWKLQRNKDVDFYDSKLPITALNSIPRVIEQMVYPGLKKADWGAEDCLRGRYISLIAALVLGFLIFQWTKELYGTNAGLLSFTFYLICPNFLAHSIFVGTDIYASLFLTATFYFLWKFYKSHKMKFFILFSLAVAMAQISKFSMIFLFLLIPVIIVTRYLAGLNKDQKRYSPIMMLAIFLLINIFVISASHLFYQMFLPLKNYSFRSTPFLQLQKLIGFFPVPLPSSYLNSLDRVMFLDSIGYDGSIPGASNTPYILGKYNSHGIWYYYFVTLFYKIPIATLLIWIGSVILYIKKSSKTLFIENEFYLLLPVIFYLAYLNFFYSTQLGIRHIMIILPALFVFSGSFYAWLIEKKKVWIIFILATYQLISVALYFPHFLPYTNEFIGNKKMAYKKIGDSNLSYGEGRKFLQSYLEKNKDAIFSPDSIISGKIVLDANRVLGLNWPASEYGYKFIWAKDLIPVDHIHSEYLIYNISPRTADSLRNIYQENINKRRY